MRVVSFITEPATIRRILDHLSKWAGATEPHLEPNARLYPSERHSAGAHSTPLVSLDEDHLLVSSPRAPT